MERLPLIQLASSFISSSELEDCYVIGVQHILPTTYTMIQALCEKGLKPENVSLIGKCYSTDMQTYHAMQRAGFDVCNKTLYFDSHVCFDTAFRKHLHEFLGARKSRLNDQKFKKIIVIDDGGECLEIVPEYLDSFDRVVGMEQTSSGYNILQNQELHFPIINIARSEAKLSCETSRIIEQGIDQLRQALANLPNKRIEKALVIGNGVIGGKMIVSLQEDGYEVFRYDVNREKSDFSSEELLAHLGEFDLIVGCTGRTSLAAKHHYLLKKGCILASVSSTDREFDAVHLRRKAPRSLRCADHIDIDGILLLNCGFPITFFMNEPDDPQFFQFIRGLIISAVAQGAALQNHAQKGFIELKREWQYRLMRAFALVQNPQEERVSLIA